MAPLVLLFIDLCDITWVSCVFSCLTQLNLIAYTVIWCVHSIIWWWVALLLVWYSDCWIYSHYLWLVPNLLLCDIHLMRPVFYHTHTGYYSWLWREKGEFPFLIYEYSNSFWYWQFHDEHIIMLDHHCYSWIAHHCYSWIALRSKICPTTAHSSEQVSCPLLVDHC